MMKSRLHLRTSLGLASFLVGCAGTASLGGNPPSVADSGPGLDASSTTAPSGGGDADDWGDASDTVNSSANDGGNGNGTTPDASFTGYCAGTVNGSECFTTIVDSETNVQSIACDGTHLFWTRWIVPTSYDAGIFYDAGVIEIVLDGGTTSMLEKLDAAEIGPIATDGVNVYWPIDGNSIKYASIDGGSGGVLSTGDGGVAFDPSDLSDTEGAVVAAAGGNVYWISPYGVGTTANIVKEPVSGGSPVTLATGLTSPNWLTVAGGQLIWSDSVDATIVAMPRGGGTPTTIASGGGVVDFTADETSLYWLSNYWGQPGYGSASLVKMPLGGSTLTTLATNVGSGLLAVDGTSLYIVEGTGIEQITPK